jgi:hypothetical protein
MAYPFDELLHYTECRTTFESSFAVTVTRRLLLHNFAIAFAAKASVKLLRLKISIKPAPHLPLRPIHPLAFWYKSIHPPTVSVALAEDTKRGRE